MKRYGGRGHVRMQHWEQTRGGMCLAFCSLEVSKNDITVLGNHFKFLWCCTWLGVSSSFFSMRPREWPCGATGPTCFRMCSVSQPGGLALKNDVALNWLDVNLSPVVFSAFIRTKQDTSLFCFIVLWVPGHAKPLAYRPGLQNHVNTQHTHPACRPLIHSRALMTQEAAFAGILWCGIFLPEAHAWAHASQEHSSSAASRQGTSI